MSVFSGLGLGLCGLEAEALNHLALAEGPSRWPSNPDKVSHEILSLDLQWKPKSWKPNSLNP